MQYVDNFFARMEHLKKASCWRSAKYDNELLEKVKWGLHKRFNVAAAERSLREALSAQHLDTQLSHGLLHELKVCFA